MAIDSSIPLSGKVQPVNLNPGINALLSVNQDQRQAQMAPLQNKLLQNQADMQQMQMDEKQRAAMRDMGEFAFESYKALRGLPIEQRDQAYQTLHALSKQMFGDMVKDDPQPLDNASLDSGIKQFSIFDQMHKVYGNASVKVVPTQTGYEVINPLTGDVLRSVIGVKPSLSERAESDVNTYSRKRDIEAQTAPVIAGAQAQAKADVEARTRPQIEADTTTARETAKADAERRSAVIKGISEEKEVGRILDMAVPLLDKATGSLSGATFDAAGRLVGASSEGSRAAAQLRTLEGALIMKMPRMEGPQSNMDQQLYRQMAAQIGDPTTPAEERKAAVEILRVLNQRYTGQPAASPQGSGGQTTSSSQQQPPAQGGQSLGTHPQYGDITEDDIQATMKANNMTREQVLQRLGGQ